MEGTTVSIPTRMLVMGVTREDGTLPARELYATGEACGLQPEQIRSCLRRLMTEGLFRREGAGRSAVYRATASGLAELGRRLDQYLRAYRQDRGLEPWDGAWRLAAFAVPERRRAARDSFRDGLRALGGAPVQGGLYVAPHAWDGAVRALAKELAVESHLTLVTARELELAGQREPRGIAAALWPVADLGARYARFERAYRGVPDALERMAKRGQRLADADFLPAALAMAVEFGACFADDPLLPPELLPRRWPGRRARELLLRCRRQALSVRAAPDRPALFRSFDATLEGHA